MVCRPRALHTTRQSYSLSEALTGRSRSLESSVRSSPFTTFPWVSESREDIPSLIPDLVASPMPLSDDVKPYKQTHRRTSSPSTSITTKESSFGVTSSVNTETRYTAARPAATSPCGNCTPFSWEAICRVDSRRYSSCRATRAKSATPPREGHIRRRPRQTRARRCGPSEKRSRKTCFCCTRRPKATDR